MTAAELRSLMGTGRTLLGSRLAMPSTHVCRRVRFADGTTSRVYRETVMRAAPSADPAVLVVRFRLRLLGHRRWAHAAFRFESLSNTPLVAGHDGFCSKLWMTDEETGVSRGIYQWDGAESATTSVETVRVVLAPWVVPGSFDYRVVADADRARFLEGSWPRRPCHLRAVTRAGGSPRRPTPVAA